MCDRHDLGNLHQPAATSRRKTTIPGVFLFDNYQGGIGFSEPLFRMHEALLLKTRELMTGATARRAAQRASVRSAIPPNGQDGCAPDSQSAASAVTDTGTGAATL